MKKMLFFKILLFFAIIGLIISFYFLFSYIYDVSKKDKLSNNIAKSYSVALLYSDNSSYSTNLNNSTIISGKDPFVIGLIKIDKIKLDYPILSNVSDELLKIAPCRFAGPLPNKIGNLCIAGHNYIDNTFFAKISRLELGDEIEIFDMNGKSIKYFYDHTGARTKKIVDGVTTEYRMAGELLVSEKEDTGKTVWYKYDSNARLISMITGGKTYIYVRNVQNDIVGLLNSNGDMVVEYVYDSWGNVLSITGSEKDTVGQINPFRYRGYYYDSETGMYYLKERYYDPKLRRFISADNYIIGSNEILANLYTYCANNPVNNYDPSGQLLKKILNWAKRKINKAIQTIHTAAKRFVRNTFSVKPSLITRRDYSTPTKVIRLTYSSSSGIPVSTSNSQSGYLYCNIINGGKDIDVGSRRNVGSMFIDSSISLMEKSISITSGVGNVSSGVQYDRDDNTIGWFVSKSSTYKNVDFEGTVGIEIDFDELMDLAKEVAIATAVVATGIAVGAAAGAGIVYLANSVAASGTLMVVALAFAG